MVRFVVWILAIGIMLACRGQLVRATIWAGRAAGHALKYEQMSYAGFTHSLLVAKPHKSPREDK